MKSLFDRAERIGMDDDAQLRLRNETFKRLQIRFPHKTSNQIWNLVTRAEAEISAENY